MIYDDLGVPRIINAYGTNTRLSGGLMAPEVLATMAEAARATVEMHHLQAAASREISKATGAEAGIVTSGASAAVLLGAAACMARLDPGAMNRLPDTRGLPDEFITIRSQRNMYDRALRVAGGRIIEIGIPDRVSGPGVRDAAPWEIADAITDRTAAIYYLAGAQSEPPLPDVVRVARERHIPVLVDAAAQLPPTENLRRFIAEGADLVCFSGGKALGGPQSSGILAGRRDLVSSALAQMLDLDMPEAEFIAPAEFTPLAQMRGLPHHGIGRSCKIGKEEIVGLIVALRRFVTENPITRSAQWQARLETVQQAAGDLPGLRLIPDGAKPGLPLLAWQLPDAAAAGIIEVRLRAHRPAIHVDASRIAQGLLAINPIAFDDGDAALLGAALKECAA
jgi:L-seryl-tRNA(Ser) seleniumtransferase